jgi:hypothetical protein
VVGSGRAGDGEAWRGCVAGTSQPFPRKRNSVHFFISEKKNLHFLSKGWVPKRVPFYFAFSFSGKKLTFFFENNEEVN